MSGGTLDVLWALFGKEERSSREYAVIANSGGEEQRRTFDDYIRASSAGNPPPEGQRGADALPWVTVSGWALETGRWIGVSVMEPADRRSHGGRRDHSGRAVVPTRFFLVQQDGPGQPDHSYLTLFQAVDGITLPPAAQESTQKAPLPPGRPGESYLTGIEHIAAVVKATSDKPERRRDAAAHWAAAVAAELLTGDSLIITHAGHLGHEDRLAVLDAVAAFLPYGLRTDLRVGTCVNSLRPPVAQLAFCSQPPPGSRPIALGRPPKASQGAAGAYRERLHRLINRLGPAKVADALWARRETLRRTDHQAILGCLNDLDIVHTVNQAIAEGSDTPAKLRDALQALHGEPPHAGWQGIVRAALAHDDPRLTDELRYQWSEPALADAMTQLVADAMPALRPGDPHRANRLRRLWETAKGLGRAADLLAALIDRPGRPTGDGEARYEFGQVVGCVRALGQEVFTAGSPAVRTLRENRPFTLGLLSAEADDAATLGSWLGTLDPDEPGTPYWLAAWSPLGRWPQGPAVVLPAADAPLAALVLDAATRGGDAGRIFHTTARLFDALVTVARAERAASGAAAAYRIPPDRAHGPGEGPAALAPAPAGPVPPRLAELLGWHEAWDSCRGLSDLLRSLTGLPLLGPLWDRAGQEEYTQAVRLVGDDPHFAPERGSAAHAMARVALGTMPDRRTADAVLTELRRIDAARELIDDYDEKERRKEEAARRAEEEARRRAEQIRLREEREEENRRKDEESRRRAEEKRLQREAARRQAPKPPVLPPPGQQSALSQQRRQPGPPPRRQAAVTPPDLEAALTRLHLVTENHITPLGTVVDAWVPLVFTVFEEQATLAVGRWWNRAMADRRDPLLHELERALAVLPGCSPEQAHRYVRRLADRIAAGELTSIVEGNPGWRADWFIEGEKRNRAEVSRRIRRARWVRVRAALHRPPRHDPPDHTTGRSGNHSGDR